MGRVLLVTGGSRSGKSRHALRCGEAHGGTRAYLATCPAGLDGEMDERIERHRREREAGGWVTVEAPLDLAAALRAQAADVVLVDCLTLWIGNLLHERGDDLDEAQVVRRAGEVLDAARGRGGAVLFVTNEVGSGIVPDNPQARRFRDLAGRCNQVVAAGADEVVLLVSGIPLRVK